MKKRFIALACILAILTGMFCVNVSAREDTDTYLVGYAIKDVNPWVDPNDHTQGILNTVQLTGNGNDYDRNCTGQMDDNDDGVIGEGDGLYTTCTAVSDTFGNTVMYFTIDALQGYSSPTSDVRTAVVEALGKDVITKDRIMVNGSHTHSGVNFNTMKKTHPDYYAYIVSQMTAAALEAYNDRAPATMSKGTINALESTKSLGYNGGEGYRMNAIRHYDMELTSGNTVKQYVSGSNFGKLYSNLGSNVKLEGVTYKVTANDNAYEADNNMHILKFTFDENSGKEPVVFVNWRAHTTNNSGGTNKTFVSSDYVNSLRTNLKKAGYRAAFLQGAAGNTVMNSVTRTDWDKETGVKDSNVYGRILADIAMDCMERKMTDPLPAGEISTLQVSYYAEKQDDGEGLLAAANQFNSEIVGNTTPAVPYKYLHTDGMTYILNSKFHASNIRTRATTTSASYTKLELNTILLGGSVAFVTAPNEISDRYDLKGSRVDADNDWLELVNEQTYGTPFVMGYSNDGKGYIPNWLEYAYNSDEYAEITGWGANGDEFFGAGSYEANSTRFARGTGEALVQQFKKMLTAMGEGKYTAMCPACKTEVEWTPLIAEQAGNQYLGTGHYYLQEDLPAAGYGENQKMVEKGDVLCLDLYGHKSEIQGRSLYINDGGTVNLMDTVGGGSMISYSGGNNVGGGVCSVLSGGTLNVYSGSMQFIRQELPEGKYETGMGGVISCSGTVNMYGGTLIGGEMLISSYYAEKPNVSNGCGGTVFMGTAGKLNVYGGKILSGKAAEGARGDCIYVPEKGAQITLSGDAYVEEIYYNKAAAVNLNISGAYSGTAALHFNSDNITLQKGMDIGNCVGADLTGSKLTCVNDSSYSFKVSGSDLLLTAPGNQTVAALCDGAGTQYFDSLQQAADAYTSGYIMLMKDETRSVNIAKELYLDLNGCDITGAVTVTDGTLYGFDSKTDDYTVADGDYGRLTNVTGSVAGAFSEESADRDGYMKVTEAEGVSFHRASLQLTAMNLRPAQVGVYYTGSFKADEVAAAYIKQFGVTLSVKAVPSAENFTTLCRCSEFTDFTAGEENATGTLLKGIMKKTNTTPINQRNANMPVYGRAYILTNDGQYLFGKAVSRNLMEQMQGVDDCWSTLTDVQTEQVLSMYGKYYFAMKDWNIPNIKNAFTNYPDIPFDDLIS